MKKTQKLPLEANKRLKEVRELMGLSREEMANLLNFTYQSYGFIERGACSLFIDRLDPLMKTAANVDYIVTGEGNPLNELNPDYFMDSYNKLDDRQKEVIKNLMETMIKQNETN